jgi:hypothetical protein
LASRRATQASHSGFNVLQDNINVIKGHCQEITCCSGETNRNWLH